MRALAIGGTEDFSPVSGFAAPSLARAGDIRVLVALPNSVALQHVCAMLVGAPGIAVVAEVARSHCAGLAVRLTPEVIITELHGANGLELAAIRSLVCAATTSRVLAVSSQPDAEWLLDALAAGAAGVISADATRDEVLGAVRAVADGLVVLGHDALAALIAHSRGDRNSEHAGTRESRRRLALLTRREHSVFRLVAEGYSAPEVGVRLSISKKTVETYKKRISQKLGFSHRADYVRFALEASTLVAPRIC